MGSPAIAGFVLAAGSGTRLRPLTEIRPKALCSVDNVPLVDLALNRVLAVTDDITVNTWHHSDQIVEHLDGRVRLSVEQEPMGTAGALAVQHDWIDGRGVLVHNADSWHQADLSDFTSSWSGDTVRLLVRDTGEPADFGTLQFCGVSLQPWSEVKTFEPVPSGLWEVSWQHLAERKELDFVVYDGPFFDCGTPEDYLAANLAANGGRNVIAPDAKVLGSIDRCVVWPAATVEAGEDLHEVIRAPGGITVAGETTAGVA